MALGGARAHELALSSELLVCHLRHTFHDFPLRVLVVHQVPLRVMVGHRRKNEFSTVQNEKQILEPKWLQYDHTSRNRDRERSLHRAASTQTWAHTLRCRSWEPLEITRRPVETNARADPNPVGGAGAPGAQGRHTSHESHKAAKDSPPTQIEEAKAGGQMAEGPQCFFIARQRRF